MMIRLDHSSDADTVTPSPSLLFHVDGPGRW